MKRIRANWNHTSEEIEGMGMAGTVEIDWLKEIAWQLAKLRESLPTQAVTTSDQYADKEYTTKFKLGSK
jgi:hypothetical protein